jgi:hypothetical protein
MPEVTNNKVEIRFDGLLRFAIDSGSNICQAEVHTAAEAHVMHIKVCTGDQVIARHVFSAKQLKELRSFVIFVGKGNPLKPINPDAKDSGNFNEILDLASDRFYGRKCDTKKGMYDCSIWLRNGEIGAGDLDDCKRVKAPLFPELKFVWETELEWEGFQRGARQMDREAIVDMGLQFARNVTARLTLNSGQSLCMTSGAAAEHLFPPLTFGKNYVIDIKYADVEPPNDLADCQGFAHHSQALELEANEPIFGIFRPSFKGATSIKPITEPGCCECARMGETANLLDQFQSQLGTTLPEGD